MVMADPTERYRSEAFFSAIRWKIRSSAMPLTPRLIRAVYAAGPSRRSPTIGRFAARITPIARVRVAGGLLSRPGVGAQKIVDCRFCPRLCVHALDDHGAGQAVGPILGGQRPR